MALVGCYGACAKEKNSGGRGRDDPFEVNGAIAEQLGDGTAGQILAADDRAGQPALHAARATARCFPPDPRCGGVF